MEKKGNLLIVDDDLNLLSTLSDVFEDCGYTVTTADTGTKAIEIAKEGKPSTVLVDIVLPDVDGIKVLHSIKEIDPDISVIILTGHASLDSSIKALQEGAYDYVLKPFNVDHIKAVIARAVERYQSQKEREQLVKTLEEKVKELEAEKNKLQMAFKLITGRELTMVELKKEVDSLLEELGKPKKYV